MIELATILNISDWIAAILVLVSVVFMFKIAKITGWFKAWSILSAAFILIVVRRTVTAYAPISSIPKELGYVNSILQFILSVMYVVSFYMLYNIFKKQKKE